MKGQDSCVITLHLKTSNGYKVSTAFRKMNHEPDRTLDEATTVKRPGITSWKTGGRIRDAPFQVVGLPFEIRTI